MAAILPALNIDSGDEKLSRYFLKHQLYWIRDESQMRFAEKSVRIGWTFGDAFKNVRKRLQFRERDYLFGTKDQQSAIEYLETCRKFADVFSFAKSIVSCGMDEMKVSGKDENGKSVVEEVKFGYIKFDNRSRILAFSSNPYAMAVFGGDVGLDEFAKHQQAEKLWETAQGRITWGYDLGVWSAHDGTDTLFYVFAQEARAGKGGWSYYRVTMEDAVENGLVEKINETRGTNLSREQFIQDCKNRARLPEVYEQAYNCNPQGSMSAIVSWATLDKCQKDYEIPRLHLEQNQVIEIAGEYNFATEDQRRSRISSAIMAAFDPLFRVPNHHRLGFDVAASGEGDLAAIYIDRKVGGQLELAGLLTCRTDDWHFLENALWTFLSRLSSIQGAGDETGLGRQICWRTAQRFPGTFVGVNFRSEKHKMGLALMNQLSATEKVIPRTQADIGQDYFSLRKIWSAGSWKFTEGRNLLNPASHCDIAWSGALASFADTAALAPGEWGSIDSDEPSPFDQSIPDMGNRRFLGL